MSTGTVGQGAVYSPLPQSVIDSDTSEEELHSSVIHQANSVAFRKQNTSPRYSVALNGQKMGDYRPLGHDSQTNGVGTTHHRSIGHENVRIVRLDKGLVSSQMKRMGPVRTFFFAFSIFVCFFTLIMFVWIIPCDWAVCPSVAHKSSIKSWERILDGLEVVGRVSVVSGRLLVLMTRGPLDGAPASEGGLVALDGAMGDVVWQTSMRRLPADIDCKLIDVNGDGVNDCLVAGKGGTLSAVDPLTGNLLWNVRPSIALDFPLILPDLDGDGVNELASSCSVANDTTSSHNRLVVLSGRFGNVLGQMFKVADCALVHSLGLNKHLNISYVCRNADGGESERLVSVRELYPASVSTSVSASVVQHETMKRGDSYEVLGRRLTLENRGRCPQACGVTVRLVDVRLGEVLWNYTAENMYAMVPATLVFNNRTLANGTVLTDPISGFVLKFWQWSYVLPVEPTHASQPSVADALVRRLRERVVLITSNATDMHIVNASQNEVVQLCRSPANNAGETHNCQPDLHFQEQSLLIADLDHDRSQELVSYYTTYVSTGPDDTNGPWKLQSRVRAIRLEAELPKLYEAVARQ